MRITGGIPVGGNLAYSDLLYRGEPVVAQRLPYYGGGFNIEQLAGGNFLGPEATKIRGASPVRQPILPGEQREAVEGVYGSPEPKPMPGSSPLGLPMAAGFNAPFNAGGALEGAQLAQGQAGDAGALLRDYIGALFNPLGFLRKTQGVANQIQERNRKQEQMINELLDRR
jgi:hypothetical protein